MMPGNRTYQEMYRKMAQATEKAVRLLIEAQQICEELYISDEESVESEEEPPQ